MELVIDYNISTKEKRRHFDCVFCSCCFSVICDEKIGD